jgi:outer membrane protein OmpA-like peptidoglycan-associated protein
MTETHFMVRTLPAAMIACAGAVLAGCSTAPAPAAAATADASFCTSGSFDIYFSEWDASLSPASREMLAAAQKKYDGCVIEHVRIVGMADASGDYNSNLEISDRRAWAVADALNRGGWPSSTFDVRSAGEQGATVEGVEQPMRRLARVTVAARAP